MFFHITSHSVLKHIITEPTRTTDTSKTAIDLICTSDVENIILPCKFTDHNVIFCTRKLMKCNLRVTIMSKLE